MREGRTTSDEECEGDVHGDHTLSINELPPLTKFEQLPRCYPDRDSDDNPKDDLVQDDQDEPVPNRLAD